MKALLHLTWFRLTEQPAKMLYLAVTLAAAIVVWIVLSAFASPALLSNSEVIKSELIIGNGRAQNIAFPVRHIPRIQQIPGVDTMYWFTVAAFFCGDGSGTTVTVYGWGGDHDDYLREEGASDTDLATWHATENGALVGSEISRQCSLLPGSTVSPDNIFGNDKLPLHVIAVLPGRGKSYRVDAHYDYINRLMEGNLGSPVRDTAIRATVTVKDPSRLDQVVQAIEQEFQSSDPPLEVTVLGDANFMLGRYGQVQALLLFIVGALALCVLLAFAAISAHLVAQRRASMTILQAIGFNGRIQYFAFSLELIGVLIGGTLLGISAGQGVLTLLKLWATDTPFTSGLRLIDGAILVLLPALLLLLLATLIWPAMQIKKLRPQRL